MTTLRIPVTCGEAAEIFTRYAAAAYTEVGQDNALVRAEMLQLFDFEHPLPLEFLDAFRWNDMLNAIRNHEGL